MPIEITITTNVDKHDRIKFGFIRFRFEAIYVQCIYTNDIHICHNEMNFLEILRVEV